MNIQSFCESKQVSFREKRSFTGNKRIKGSSRYAELCGGFVGDPLLLWNVVASSSAIFLQFGVQYWNIASMLAQYVLDLVPQDKPEIVYAVVSQR